MILRLILLYVWVITFFTNRL